MKYMKITYNQLIISLLFLFYILKYSLNSIQTGQYPYISRLNNGNYIILSSNSIIFADPTLTNELTKITFDSLYYSLDNAGSATVGQFKAVDNEYIIAIINNKIFILSSNGELLSELIDLKINSKYICSVIPKSHSDNKYYFSLIYGYEEGKIEICNSIIFNTCIFDSITNITIINNSISFDPFNGTDFYPQISCHIMKNNSEEYISCLYGNDDNFVITIFNLNDYSIVATQENNIGGKYFKSVILPNEREKGIFCTYKEGQSFYCLNYDITKNILDGQIKINEGGCLIQLL